ncbi:FHA domain-containing protein (plasmid) [Acaryochloris sp. 'Moss Beach']|uniref:FHA domain-containing protein n=1 Tax=Acaryochloris sp. 'Moss Beach' TaxID=2740837 RepID=UPI001F20D84A|nr:FHA domain-containing protein [Acaryochloris sp. 'Moss Beach']UJB72441.1 FHA domain-containing protein [Acaryochloris sp. 'Moss Beach']
MLTGHQNILNFSETNLKIKFVVVSDSLTRSNKFLNLVCGYKELKSNYDFQSISLDSIFRNINSKTQDFSSACLIFRNSQNLNSSHQSKPLKKKLVIGRDLNKLRQQAINSNSDILDFPEYKKVSSVHAEIIIKPYSNSQIWQIIDLGSKNSTYVNGEKLLPHSSRDLYDGDKIILGSPSSSEKYPEFTFNNRNVASSYEGNKIDDLINQRLFILVIDPSKLFDENSQAFIKRVSKLEKIFHSDRWKLS